MEESARITSEIATMGRLAPSMTASQGGAGALLAMSKK